MLTTLTIVIIGLAALYVVLAPMPESDLLPPGPSLWQRHRARRAEHTMEEANTLDWIERVKDAPERVPEPRRRRPVETVKAPPWEAAPEPSDTEQTIVPDYYSGKRIGAMLSSPPPPMPAQPPRFWPAGQTGAHELVRAALDRPLQGPPGTPDWPSEPEPAPDPEREPGPEAEQGWPPELPVGEPPDPADSTIVRGIKAFTRADLEDYIRKMDAYKGRT